MRVIDELTKNETWRKLSGIKRDTRMKGAELVLRFMAFRYNRSQYAKPLSGFLDDFSSSHRNMDEKEIDSWADDFATTLDLVDFALGRLAFRIYDEKLRPNTNFNSALFDAQMIAFAETTNLAINNKDFDPNHLQRLGLSLFASERFENSIRQATSDEQAVRARIDMYLAFLQRYPNAL